MGRPNLGISSLGNQKKLKKHLSTPNYLVQGNLVQEYRVREKEPVKTESGNAQSGKAGSGFFNSRIEI